VQAAACGHAVDDRHCRGHDRRRRLRSRRPRRFHRGCDREGESWRTAFSFATDHRPGALHKAIEPFGRHSLDLVQLVSRPIPSTPWRYRFDAVLAGHPLDPIVTETLAEVQGLTRELRVFGSYPAYT
jgi:prephenate dehydratase